MHNYPIMRSMSKENLIRKSDQSCYVSVECPDLKTADISLYNKLLHKNLGRELATCFSRMFEIIEDR